MGLLVHFVKHRKERKAAKELPETTDQSYDTEVQKSNSSNLSQRIKEDIRTLRKSHPELQSTSKLENPSSTFQNAGSSINFPKRSASDKGLLSVQKKHRASSKNDTRPEDIPSDGYTSSGDSSSTSSKKRSAESKAPRERQREMINLQSTPNDSLKNQSLLVITIPWLYPDTRCCNYRNGGVHSSDWDKTTETTPTSEGNVSGTGSGDKIKETDSSNLVSGIHKEPRNPVFGGLPESSHHHQPVSCHTPYGP
ncbi:hypothetical protein TWF569_009859 [Orbilia oligospora]|uniref:Uncharacterized protein n=1 Tax=Orbilia oligospora TaxID=2813651 RepID=A0A7C8JNJ3_ORBOL|nr:hypothetical protein TWF706_009115 [Orbilia oligospora]KAF3100283.1 hypothetical protein TWF103_008301 [Orbilia oligospora]KAF3112680.1 hypothetical protein TWF102_004081 [Orbilia oligospora]KAF3120901.1 hypothetical protein TWF703_002275 [Orbilia oligospora]KAF3123260.1 hypothetical protein TWF594_002479 [Orbilia oligospora]